jgi:hypothetical protein
MIAFCKAGSSSSQISNGIWGIKFGYLFVAQASVLSTVEQSRTAIFLVSSASLVKFSLFLTGDLSAQTCPADKELIMLVVPAAFQAVSST